ncbi:TPA: hypothetical protein QDB01_000375 [Burkholderia vietnamiensis]|nr:hypothetical protein [Burkholderia vietnamiensis]
MESLLSRPGADERGPEPNGRYADYSRIDGFDLITLLTWRFVQRPQTEGDPEPDPAVPEGLRLSDEVLEEWRQVIERGTPDHRPYVTRHELIDPRATQVRTLAINSPLAHQGVHTAGILKKIKWGELLRQILLVTGSTYVQDWGSAIKQVGDIFGALDMSVANLTHREAAVLTVAHDFKRPEWAHRWLWRCNDLLARWSDPKHDLRIDEGEFFQTLLDVVNRGIEVEVPEEGERFPPLLTAFDGPGIFAARKVRIRPMIVLLNW